MQAVLLVEVVVEVVVLVVQSRPDEPKNISLSTAVEVIHAPHSVRAKDEAPLNM